MTHYPLLATDPVSRALAEGRQTQDRRPCKVQPDKACNWAVNGMRFDYADDSLEAAKAMLCAMDPVKPGDLFYVRECFCQKADENGRPIEAYWYRADGDWVRVVDGDGWGVVNKDGTEKSPWKPSIHMPKKAARTWLRVKRVWVERVQEISEDDAKAEGCESGGGPIGFVLEPTAKYRFSLLWNSMYGLKPGLDWQANPFVIARELERIGAP